MRIFSTLAVVTFSYWMLSCTTSEQKSETAAVENVMVTLEPTDFKSKLESSPGAVLLDVRTPDEVATGKISGAINIDYKDSAFSEKINAMDKTKPYFVYCLSGKRSGSAAAKMEEAGFKEIYTLKDGLQRWTKDGLATTEPK